MAAAQVDRRRSGGKVRVGWGRETSQLIPSQPNPSQITPYRIIPPHIIPSYPTPTEPNRPIPSHPIPSHPIHSHPTPPYLSPVQSTPLHSNPTPATPPRPTISVAAVNDQLQPEPDRGNVPLYSYSLAGVILASEWASARPVRYRTIPFHTIRYDTIYHATPNCTTPHHIKLHYTIPYHTIPYRTMPSHTMPCHAMPYRIIPYRTVPYHTIPCLTIPYQPYHTKTHHTTPYHPHAVTLSCVAHMPSTSAAHSGVIMGAATASSTRLNVLNRSTIHSHSPRSMSYLRFSPGALMTSQAGWSVRMGTGHQVAHSIRPSCRI